MSKWTFHEDFENPEQDLKKWEQELRQFIPDESLRSKLRSMCGKRPGSDFEHTLITRYKDFKHPEFGQGVLFREFTIDYKPHSFQTADGLVVDARKPDHIRAWLIEAKNDVDIAEGI